MVKLTTINSLYKNKELISTYNEIHEVLGLQNIDHIFATIESVVRNNLKYSNHDIKLESITVSMSFTERKTLSKIISHYADNPIDCPVNAGMYLVS